MSLADAKKSPLEVGRPESKGPSIRLRGTHRISWMISSWFKSVELMFGQGGTASLTIGCPDDFYAVRLGFANITPNPWKITKAIGHTSTTFNDYVRPTGDSLWTPFTFAGQGADNDFIVNKPDAPTEITVSGNGAQAVAGDAFIPAWTWTDWAAIRSAAPDPATGMRVLMLRALIPSAQTICYANSQLRTFTGNISLNLGFDYFIGGIKFDFDRVTDPTVHIHESTTVWRDNQLATGSLFPIVQFLTKNAGIVGITTGDSHHQGATTADESANYLYRTTTELGRRSIGKIPFGMVNCAVGGLTSEDFFPRVAALLHAVRPSYVVLPGWSYNDCSGYIHADQAAVDRFIAYLVETAELCENSGVLPIFLTPFPRDAESMSVIQLGPWRELREIILKMKSAGAIVLDATSLLGRTVAGEFDGTYLPGLSDDTIHPNDKAHLAVANELISLLQVIGEQSVS
jgi:hypothetical protein